MTNHALLTWAVIFFMVLNLSGAAFSIARVYFRWKQQQQSYVPSSTTTHNFGPNHIVLSYLTKKDDALTKPLKYAAMMAVFSSALIALIKFVVH